MKFCIWMTNCHPVAMLCVCLIDNLNTSRVCYLSFIFSLPIVSLSLTYIYWWLYLYRYKSLFGYLTSPFVHHMVVAYSLNAVVLSHFFFCSVCFQIPSGVVDSTINHHHFFSQSIKSVSYRHWTGSTLSNRMFAVKYRHSIQIFLLLYISISVRNNL